MTEPTPTVARFTVSIKTVHEKAEYSLTLTPLALAFVIFAFYIIPFYLQGILAIVSFLVVNRQVSPLLDRLQSTIGFISHVMSKYVTYDKKGIKEEDGTKRSILQDETETEDSEEDDGDETDDGGVCPISERSKGGVDNDKFSPAVSFQPIDLTPNSILPPLPPRNSSI